MFASANLSKRSWLNTPAVKEPKEKKTKASKRIKWDFFVKLHDHEHDKFWKNYWERASRGIFPSGFTFNGKELCYTYRNKCTKALVNDNISDMCQLMKSMLQENGNIYSPNDLKRLTLINGLDNNANVVECWSTCSNSQKSSLVDFYLLDLAEEYGLSKREQDELYQTLNVGIIIGAFDNKSIIIEDNRIVEIIGLDWNDDTGKFYINTEKSPFKIKKPTNTVSKKSSPYCFLSEWKKLNKPKNKKKVNEVDITNINNSLSSCYVDN